MAITAHTNWSQGSYRNDRDALLRVLENRDLARGNLLYLHPYFDTSIAIGYGFDLLSRDVPEIQYYLSQTNVNGTITQTGSNLLNTYRQTIRNTPQDTQQYRRNLAIQLYNEVTLPSEPAANNLLVHFLDTLTEPRIPLTVLPESKERVAYVLFLQCRQ
jgi:hypothetical protein